MGCARAWQEKFSESHEEVSVDQSVLSAAFSAYHASDLRSGQIKKIKKEKEDKKKPSKQTSYRPFCSDDR